MGLRTVRVTIENYSLFDDIVAWRMNGKERTDEEKITNKNFSLENIRYNLDHEGFYVYGALLENRFVGWISLIYLPKIGVWDNGIIYVDELWTAPLYRNNGVGQRLMEKAFELQKELNACKIRLYVNPENIAAVRLYEKCGLLNLGNALFMQS
ncbi:MAG: Acetyltransferase family [Anaerosolibacter sp.]|jgi:ribosomal protein S18 acetylase RimI-like enzyme|uniref:GNAT family N-acetyltransferase n=1 Tax=Anaerosolibacter sp. TaxID=1872527 RepID=UPI002636B3A5|nr:GNAT family N-acetyltransferase [Anaerosolibacter sp.]MDF2548899.1 Acetyltransferase family [Anaerosolibacter sp.]